jgi:enoyl-[acyl-carrier protein] reductase II
MIHTPVCDLLQIRHPVVLGGMASGTAVPLVAAVSNAGGLGTLGIARTPADQIPKDIGAIRDMTKAPFGVNFLLRPCSLPPGRGRIRICGRSSAGRTRPAVR